jgi:cytosine/adenosine deaminase-related metal-dependent hydrolase
MDRQDAVRDDGVVYVEKGCVKDVRDRQQPAPDGFETTAVLQTGGTIFPGLIELHNHLSYNALPLWAPVPKAFDNRDQWADYRDYRRLVSGPMAVVGKTPELLPALVRYVECKCLLAGVTTSQGIRLSSNSGVSRYYRGIVRNVEQTREAALPEAQTRIQDVDARDARAFKQELVLSQGRRCYLLHLSEGLTEPGHPDSAARRHFLALEVAPDDWALTDALAGIHAAGLLPGDFERLAEKGSSMVWSPLSNLLLYGQTARVEAARAAGLKIGLGGDWSPSGSKNLLTELKVAWLYSQRFLDGLFGARDIVAMATRTAARILKWDAALGSIEAGKRADLVVVDGAAGDPWDSLVRAVETSVRLVVINGVPRYGVRELMDPLGGGDETVRIGGETRRLRLAQESVPGEVAAVPLAKAESVLSGAFRDIRKLALELERQPGTRTLRRAAAVDAAEPVVWTLALDETRDTGLDLRPRLPYSGPRDFTGPAAFSRRAARAAASTKLSEILQPIALDPLTVVDDEDFLEQVAGQPNVPEAVRDGLRGFY